MTARLIRSKSELLAALRARCDQLNVSYASIEDLIGVTGGYLSKVIAARPVKGLSAAMLQDLLDALALGIVAVVVDENPEQAERVRPRWVQRKRPPTTPSCGASLISANERTVDLDDNERTDDAAESS